MIRSWPLLHRLLHVLAVRQAAWSSLVACFLVISSLMLPLSALARDILMISSYHPEFPWTKACEQGIRQGLGAGYSLETSYLDSKRQSNDEVRRRSEGLWQRIQGHPPELVILGDDHALRLLGPLLANTSIPVVYYGINGNPRDYFDRGLPGNITGVLERMPLRQSFRYFRKLLPEAKKALVLLDRSQTSRALIKQNFPHNAPASIEGIEAEYRVIEGWRSWQQVIRSAEGYDFLLFGTFFTLQDPELGAISAPEVVRWSVAHSDVPIFTSQPFSVQTQGALGALAVEPVQHGRLAAQQVLSILEEGLKPNEFQPAMDRVGVFFLNPYQFSRFSLTVPESLRSSIYFQ